MTKGNESEIFEEEISKKIDFNKEMRYIHNTYEEEIIKYRIESKIIFDEYLEFLFNGNFLFIYFYF